MSFNWLTLVFLLLPVAFISGWFLARRNNARQGRKIKPSFSHQTDYFKGLNYVLNEEPDKAIEIFVKMIELDSETVETHLALGNLFRRRGEVDRAIRIHQNLIARPALSSEYRAQALLELGRDYLRLGILDRAEGLFTELIAADKLTRQSFKCLLDIYQQVQDWDKAITTARRLENITGEDHAQIISQFYCELACVDAANNDEKSGKVHIKRALNINPRCVRASLMEGALNMQNGNARVAISAYKRVEQQDPAYISEILEPLVDCYMQNGHQDKLQEYLADLFQRTGSVSVLAMLTELIAKNEGDDVAIAFLSGRLQEHPSVEGVDQLINYVVPKSDGKIQGHLNLIKGLTSRLLQAMPAYRCTQCGLETRKIQWYCPGCKNWNTVRPVEEV